MSDLRVLISRLASDGRWAIVCPFCSAEHFHGPVPGPRLSHCRPGGTYTVAAPRG